MSNKSKGKSKEKFDELLKSLKNIENKLDILISLQRLSAPKATTGDEQKRILDLCDKKHTIKDMVQETGKKEGTINSTLDALRRKGLIQSIKIDKKTVYERIR